jgi:hypothetical protein
MREYGRLHVSFWTSDTIRSLGDDGRTLAAYLITCEHNTIIGAFRLPAAYACDDLGWDLERFKKAFRTVEDAGFAIYCRKSQWVCIVKFLEWNKPENPNQIKAVTKALAGLPETSFSEGLRNGSLTVGKQGAGTGEGTEAGAGDVPPAPKVRRAKPAELPFSEWFASVEDAVPDDDPLFAWADKTAIPREWIAYAWAAFADRYTAKPDKTYADWRAAFRDHVKRGWLDIWRTDRSGAFLLTTVGEQWRKAS